MSRPRRVRGLTLYETIVVMLVFSLLTLTITELLHGGLRAWRKGQIRMQLRSDARYAIDQIQADFRQCSAIGVGNIQPSAAGTKSSTLQFSRYDNTGASTKTITYTINASGQLTRQEGTNTDVIAENIVATDPRDSVQKSYFAWEDNNLNTMGIHLYLVQGATVTPLSAASTQNLESVYLHSGAVWQSQYTKNVGAATGAATGVDPAAVSVNTPATLVDPRRRAHLK